MMSQNGLYVLNSVMLVMTAKCFSESLQACLFNSATICAPPSACEKTGPKAESLYWTHYWCRPSHRSEPCPTAPYWVTMALLTKCHCYEHLHMSWNKCCRIIGHCKWIREPQLSWVQWRAQLAKYNCISPGEL